MVSILADMDTEMLSSPFEQVRSEIQASAFGSRDQAFEISDDVLRRSLSAAVERLRDPFGLDGYAHLCSPMRADRPSRQEWCSA